MLLAGLACPWTQDFSDAAVPEGKEQPPTSGASQQLPQAHAQGEVLKPESRRCSAGCHSETSVGLSQASDAGWSVRGPAAPSLGCWHWQALRQHYRNPEAEEAN